MIVLGSVVILEQSFPFKNLEQGPLVVGGINVVDTVFLCEVSVTSVVGCFVPVLDEISVVEETFVVVMCVGDIVVDNMMVVPFLTCIVLVEMGRLVAVVDATGQFCSSSPFGHC